MGKLGSQPNNWGTWFIKRLWAPCACNVCIDSVNSTFSTVMPTLHMITLHMYIYYIYTIYILYIYTIYIYYIYTIYILYIYYIYTIYTYIYIYIQIFTVFISDWDPSCTWVVSWPHNLQRIKHWWSLQKLRKWGTLTRISLKQQAPRERSHATREILDCVNPIAAGQTRYAQLRIRNFGCGSVHPCTFPFPQSDCAMPCSVGSNVSPIGRETHKKAPLRHAMPELWRTHEALRRSQGPWSLAPLASQRRSVHRSSMRAFWWGIVGYDEI